MKEKRTLFWAEHVETLHFFSALKAHISCDLLPHAIPHVKTYSFR